MSEATPSVYPALWLFSCRCHSGCRSSTFARFCSLGNRSLRLAWESISPVRQPQLDLICQAVTLSLGMDSHHLRVLDSALVVRNASVSSALCRNSQTPWPLGAGWLLAARCFCFSFQTSGSSSWQIGHRWACLALFSCCFVLWLASQTLKAIDEQQFSRLLLGNQELSVLCSK